MAIDCNHPRPKLNLPGHTSPRLRWAVPAVIPGLPPDATRVIRQALQGIFDEMLDRFSTRTAAPLLDQVQHLRAGQIVRGVANGQTLVMPLDALGTQDPVTVIITDVASPVTIAYPDGSTDTLSTPGVYDFEPSGDAPAWATTALASGSIPIGSLAAIADETFLGNVSGGAASPSAILLSTLAGDGLAWDATNNHFDVTGSTSITVTGDQVQRSALVGDITAALNVNTTAFRLFSARSVLANATNGNAIPTELQGTTNQFLKVNSAGNALAFETVTSTTIGQSGGTLIREALTGDVTAPQNSNTTAFRLFSARSVVANATNANAIPTELQGATAHHVLKVNSATTALVFEGLTLAAFPTIADDTFLANISGGTAVPTAVALTTLAGAGLTGGADAILAVGAGTGITVNANDVQLTTIADDTFMANVSGGAAVATGKTFTSLAGLGLAYDATAHELDIDLADIDSTSIVINGTTLERAALTGAVVATQNSNATLFGGILDNGAAENNRTNLNFIAGTNTTATVTDDAGNDELEIRFNVDDYPLTGLADQAAGTLVANITAGAAPPTAHALATLAGGGLTYTNVTGIMAVGAGTGITVNANDVQLTTIADDTFMANVSGGAAVATGKTFASLAGLGIEYDATNHELDVTLTDLDSTSIVVNAGTFERAALTGDVTASQNSNATTIANDAVTYAKLQNVAGFSVVGKATTGSGDAADITLGSDEVLAKSGAGNVDGLGFQALADATFGNVNGGAAFRTGGVWAQLTPAESVDMEAEDATVEWVIPSVVKFHPGVCKVWGVVSGSSTTVFASYNLTSITHTGTGNTQVVPNIDFSSVNYNPVVSNANAAGTVHVTYVDSGATLATSFRIRTADLAGAAADPGALCFACFGDQ